MLFKVQGTRFLAHSSAFSINGSVPFEQGLLAGGRNLIIKIQYRFCKQFHSS